MSASHSLAQGASASSVEHGAAIKHLSSLCRGEISAVETYGQALHADISARYAVRLKRCQASHQTRVDLLRFQIGSLGGVPPADSGTWGRFANAVELLARAAGTRAVLAALERGEDHGLAQYREPTQELDAGSNALLSQRLLPLQLETRRIVGDLRCNLS